MTHRLIKSVTLSALIILSGACFYAPVAGASQAAPPQPLLLAALSLGDAAKRVAKQTGGKVLSAKKVKKGNRVVYSIKVLLPNGKVKIVQVNPN